jgi:hypothetical protein
MFLSHLKCGLGKKGVQEKNNGNKTTSCSQDSITCVKQAWRLALQVLQDLLHLMQLVLP